MSLRRTNFLIGRGGTPSSFFSSSTRFSSESIAMIKELERRENDCDEVMSQTQFSSMYFILENVIIRMNLLLKKISHLNGLR